MTVIRFSEFAMHTYCSRYKISSIGKENCVKIRLAIEGLFSAFLSGQAFKLFIYFLLCSFKGI